MEAVEASVRAHLDRARDAATPGEALEAAQTACDRARRDLGPAHPLTLASLRGAGLYALEAGALPTARRCLEAFDRVLDPADPRRFLARADLAMLRIAEGDPALAEAELRALLDELEPLDEPGALQLALLGALAVLEARDPSRLDEARRTAARIFDCALESAGEEASVVGEALLFRAVLDLRAGEPRAGRALAREAARILGRGTDARTKTAVALEVQAEACRQLKEEEEAERLGAEARALAPNVSFELEAELLRLRPEPPLGVR